MGVKGVEPLRITPSDFKSDAFTCFAILPPFLFVHVLLLCYISNEVIATLTEVMKMFIGTYINKWYFFLSNYLLILKSTFLMPCWFYTFCATFRTGSEYLRHWHSLAFTSTSSLRQAGIPDPP